MNARDLIARLNRCWLAGDLQGVGACYHPEAVLLPPDCGDPIIGRDAIAETYRDFQQAAQVHAFEVTALDIFDFPPTGICHMRFRMDYSLGEQRLVESGLEIYLVQSSADAAVICWRQQIMLDSDSLSSH